MDFSHQQYEQSERSNLRSHTVRNTAFFFARKFCLQNLVGKCLEVLGQQFFYRLVYEFHQFFVSRGENHPKRVSPFFYNDGHDFQGNAVDGSEIQPAPPDMSKTF